MPPRDFNRGEAKLDARLIVIACEGQKTEVKYFDAARGHFRGSRLRVVVLQRPVGAEGNSSPAAVLEELDQFREDFRLEKFDELWMVIDTDNWGEKQLSDVCSKVGQKNYFIAVSRPCFEIWFLFHFKTLGDYNEKSGPLESCTELETEMRTILGSYNKTKPPTDSLLPLTDRAMQNARAADANPSDRWPQSPGTRVYRLMETIGKLADN